MSAPVIPSGGSSTTNRKWVPEINLGTALSPQWTPLGYVNNFVPTPDSGSMQDDTGFGDGGFSSQAKTGAAFSVTATVMRKVPDGAPTTYDPAQEFVRQHSIGMFGGAARIQIRWYEFDLNDPTGLVSPRIEAYMGYTTVQWAPQGGAQDGLDTVQITFTGNGKLNQVSHPYPATPQVPLINSHTPVGNLNAAGGQAVHIYGQHFTGTTGVTFAGTAAAWFSVESDGEIICNTPAHTAGSGALVVTNATGASTTGGSVTFA